MEFFHQTSYGVTNTLQATVDIIMEALSWKAHKMGTEVKGGKELNGYYSTLQLWIHRLKLTAAKIFFSTGD